MDSSWTTLVSLTCFHYCVVFLCFGHIRELRDSVFIQMMIAKERMRYKALINMTSSMMNGRITFSVEWWFRTTKNRESRCKYWANRSSVRSFAHTTHCSAHTAALICLLLRSLTPMLVGKWIIRGPKTTWLCPTLRYELVHICLDHLFPYRFLSAPVELSLTRVSYSSDSYVGVHM